MSGPVWRYEKSEVGICDVCFREYTGLFVEGEVRDNQLFAVRRVCPSCLGPGGTLVLNGEAGIRRPGPAYAEQR